MAVPPPIPPRVARSSPSPNRPHPMAQAEPVARSKRDFNCFILPQHKTPPCSAGKLPDGYFFPQQPAARGENSPEPSSLVVPEGSSIWEASWSASPTSCVLQASPAPSSSRSTGGLGLARRCSTQCPLWPRGPEVGDTEHGMLRGWHPAFGVAQCPSSSSPCK